VAEGTTRQLRVLHIVSSGGIAEAMQATLFMPLLTRLPKQRVKAQVIALAPGCVRAPVLRQNGVPVHEVALSRQRFSLGAFKELMSIVHTFRPDIVQAWGHTAQLTSIRVRAGCDWKPRVVWSVVETAPLPKNAGLIDRQKLKLVAKAAARADRIVYTSEAAAAHHRRAGYPDGGYESISPGVDPVRFKPDLAARNKVRQQLKLPSDAFVVGMVAPFQPEYDHATFLKAAGELIKTNPKLHVVLAGHGVQRGNAALMAMVGGGTLGTRTLLLGEVSDLSSLFNACDLVCLSALTDAARMTLAMAMLCGIPCVATGMGAQGELIGQHGVAVEPGSPQAFVRGITKVMQLPPERRMYLAQGARKHALQNLAYVRSLQRYLQLYAGLVGREALAVNAIAAPEVDASIPVAPPPKAEPEPRKDAAAIAADMSDPDSLEAKVAPAQPEPLPKWRLEQEAARAKMEEQSSASRSDSDGDVLQLFEQELAKPVTKITPMQERARGVVEDFEELLPVEALTAPAPAPASAAPVVKQPPKETAVAPKSDASAPSTSSAPAPAAAQPPAQPTVATQPAATSMPATSATPQPAVAPAPSATSAAPQAQPATVAAPSETVSTPQPVAVSVPAAAGAAPQDPPTTIAAPSATVSTAQPVVASVPAAASAALQDPPTTVAAPSATVSTPQPAAVSVPAAGAALQDQPAAVATPSATVSPPQPVAVPVPAAASAATRDQPAPATAPSVASAVPSPQPDVAAAPSEATVAAQPAAVSMPIEPSIPSQSDVAQAASQPSVQPSPSIAFEQPAEEKSISQTNQSAEPQADQAAKASDTGEHITATGEIKLLENEASDSLQAQLDFGETEPNEPVQVSLFDAEPAPAPEKKLMSG